MYLNFKNCYILFLILKPEALGRTHCVYYIKNIPVTVTDRPLILS